MERGLLAAEPVLTPLCSTLFLVRLHFPTLSWNGALWGTPVVLTSLPSEAFKAGLLGVGWLWFPGQQGSSFSVSPSPGEEDTPQSGVFWKRSRNPRAQLRLADDILPRTGFPLALSLLSFSLYPSGRTGVNGGCCAPWVLQASAKQPNPQ